jgi:Kelch motif
MAQRALPAGTTVSRRRAMFGLLDADGWAWASVKAGIWLVIIVLMLGYIPDRAYYLTAARTVDFGVLAWSPINFCPDSNRSLPCPAPVGAVVPWDAIAPTQIQLPAGRTDGAVVQVGTRLLYLGGSDGTKAQSTVYVATTVGTGNFDKWSEGPPLPAPRTKAAVAYVAGSIYVIGGLDDTGAPTTTVFQLTPNGTTGDIGTWAAVDALALPEARSGAAATATSDGLLIIGGSNATGPVTTTWKSILSATGTLGAFTAQAPMAQAQTGATAAVEGNFVWLFGGSDAKGPTATVQRGSIGLVAAAGFPANPDAGKVTAWATNAAVDLPAPRAGAATWSTNGALYVVGGTDGTAPKTELYWGIPSADGNTLEWLHLAVSDLPNGLVGGAPVISGPDAIIVGGTDASGVRTGSYRAGIAPQPPFFRLGLVGATVPGLTINGEIGQQLGYLNAAGAGTVDFVILIIIGWGFAHKEQSRRLMARVLRRRH